MFLVGSWVATGLRAILARIVIEQGVVVMVFVPYDEGVMAAGVVVSGGRPHVVRGGRGPWRTVRCLPADHFH